MTSKNISIVGTGLIGCSIAMGLRGNSNRIYGFDTNAESIDYALKSGIIDSQASLEKICCISDIIIVSVPVDVALLLVPMILLKCKNDSVVIDVGSTKKPICSALQNNPKRANFVAAHPMAGADVGGSQNADAAILVGRKVVICQSELNSDFAMEQALDLFETLGMQPEFMDAVQHDSLVALVSHLPQMIAYGLANTVSKVSPDDEWCRLAAFGFDSTSRLASSPANVWMPIINQNKDFIVQYLDFFINQMENLKEMITDNNVSELERFIAQSQNIREKFKKRTIVNEKYNHGNKTFRRLGSTTVVETKVE